MSLFSFTKKPEKEIEQERGERKAFIAKEKKVVTGFRGAVNKHNPIPRSQPKPKAERSKVHLNVGGQRITISSSGGSTKEPRAIPRPVPQHQSGNFIKFAGERTIGRGSLVHGQVNPINGAGERVFSNSRGGHENVSKFRKNTDYAINNIFNRKK